MPAEDEFRKVAEDVRELARTLRSELRTAKWEAKDAARQARREWRSYYRSTYPGPHRDHWQQWQDWTAAHSQQAGAPPYPPTDAPAGAPGAPPYPPTDAPPGRPDGAPNGPPPRPGWGPGPRPGSWGEWATRVIPHPPSSPAATPGPPVWYPPRPPRPPRAPKPPRGKRSGLPPVRHKRDGSTLISLLLVILGLAWLASETGVFTISLEAALAVLLAVLGAVMVVTARTDWGLSRSHWPVWLGIGLLAVLLVSANGTAISSGLSSLHFGPVGSSPVAWRDASGTVSNLAGPVTVDLTNLTPGKGNETLRVRNTFGPISVTLPSDPKGYQIQVIERTAFGPVSGPGASPSGGTFTSHTSHVGTTGPTLTLDVRDAFGPVTVGPARAGNLSPAPTPTEPPLPTSPSVPQ